MTLHITSQHILNRVMSVISAHTVKAPVHPHTACGQMTTVYLSSEQMEQREQCANPSFPSVYSKIKCERRYHR